MTKSGEIGMGIDISSTAVRTEHGLSEQARSRLGVDAGIAENPDGPILENDITLSL